MSTAQNANQVLLESHLHSIFPRLNIVRNARQEAAIKNPYTKKYLEVDAWVPAINLCFEFQDDYHFQPAWYAHTSLNVIHQKDNIKRTAMLKKRQTLITVPYWWDGELASLQDTIRFHRPELDLEHVGNTVEIPANPPLHFVEETRLMLASFPKLFNVENKTWWVGEKWDGIRCYWNTYEKQLYTRYNTTIDINSPSLDRSLDFLALDGELWCGRGFFYESQTIVGTLGQFDISFLRLMSFDEASLFTQTQPFETRYALILSHLPLDHPMAMVAPRFLSESDTLVSDMLQAIVDQGGEGLILRKPLSRYLPGRSDSLIKYKTLNADQEALVIKVEVDGSLLLQLPNGFTFSVAKKDCLLHQRAVKGDIVTFSTDFLNYMQNHHLQKSSEMDFLQDTPVVYRIRSDLSWEDVITNDTEPSNLEGTRHQLSKASFSRTLNSRTSGFEVLSPAFLKIPIKRNKPEPKTPEAQPWKTIESRRAYFDKFAALKGMDPLNPEFWYNTTIPELDRYKKALSHIASYHGHKLSSTLIQLYPNIGLQARRFRGNEHPWKTLSARREYFDTFAAVSNKDPLNPQFWYTVTMRQLELYRKGAAAIMLYHGGTLSSTLMQLYPNIGLKRHHFNVNDKPWKKESARREYFDKFAASRGMDPLNPVFWRKVTTRDLDKFNKSYKSLVLVYGGSLSETLVRLYPNIGLEKYMFTKPPAVPWKRESGRRAFFENFATYRGMDSLNPVFWYSVTTGQLKRYNPGYRAIASYYGTKLSSTLMSLFPNIGLQRELINEPEHSQKHEKARRAFFDQIALANGMDELNPLFWYSVSPLYLRKFKGYNTIITYYGHKLSSTLLQLYPNIGLQKHLLRDRTNKPTN